LNKYPALRTSIQSPSEFRRINTVGVFPYLKAETVSSCEVGYDITQELRRAFRAEGGLEVSTDEIRVSDPGLNATEENIRAASLASKNLGLDGALVLTLRTCQLRKGSAVGSEHPAAVGFDVVLLSSSEGEAVWSASYFRKDEALSDNLLNLGRNLKSGPAFDTAASLLKDGLWSTAREFSLARQSHYLKPAQ
ncbi:MAG: hypothetical protein KDD53_09145, partial [Bdellovibrionales bacterium]|nr:hypothetical protein [Bdellovibrionales bacterium]